MSLSQNGLFLYCPNFSGIDSMASASAGPLPSVRMSLMCVMYDRTQKTIAPLFFRYTSDCRSHRR
jgi:hypothetical protein